MKLCEICNNPGEKHHGIFRSQSICMIDMPVNYFWLCNVHHRGKISPHRDRELDLKYKRIVQKRLEETLFSDYYRLEGLKKALKVTDSKVRRIVKTLTTHKEGYKSTEIIMYLLGGRFYD